MAGPYTDLANTLRTDGVCVFDADAPLGKYKSFDKAASHPDGVKIDLKDDKGAIVAADVLVHKNGRQGAKDESKDSLVISLSTLARLPDDLQAKLWDYEQTPGGRRDPLVAGGKKVPVRGK